MCEEPAGCFSENLEGRLLNIKMCTREPTYKMLARTLCCEVCGVPGQTLMKKATGISYWKLKVKLLNMNIWSWASCRSPS